MKKALSIIVCMALALSIAAMAAAQTAPAKRTSTQPVVKGKNRILAIVVSVDQTASSYIVVQYKKTQLTYQVDPEAKIILNRKICKLTDLKKGYKVTIIHREGSEKNVAVVLIAQSMTISDNAGKPEAKPSTE